MSVEAFTRLSFSLQVLGADLCHRELRALQVCAGISLLQETPFLAISLSLGTERPAPHLMAPVRIADPYHR